ncbi:MAG: hypothetical protein H0V26_07810 [Solirubrobacterales bacterium]|nr:hypothetical protein [Solirubrobacterales bacterium]
MHNRALRDTLAGFVEEAADQLAADVAGGAEIAFEIDPISSSRASSPLYCYRPLMGSFIAGRAGALSRLPSYPAAARGLGALPGLDTYLEARGERISSEDRRARPDAAICAFLADVWSDATDFVFDPVRFDASYSALESAAYDGWALTVVLTAVEGLVIESDEVAVASGLALVRATALDDGPPELRGDAFTTVAVLALESGPGEPGGLEAAGSGLRRLQTALRLWDDAEPAVGPTAWARTDGGPWMQIPLGGGPRRMSLDCLLAVEEEDALRAFFSLVSRRTPRAGELAWALRRFELGCERPTALEALTDWLLAVRALLADPSTDGLQAAVERLAAICAPPELREGLAERLTRAAGLERCAVAGLVRPEPAVEALVAELGGQMRAVLRDVLCGHLDADLRSVADRLIDARPVAPDGRLTAGEPALG